MKAVITLDVNAGTIEEAQRILDDACSRLQAAGRIAGYRFEIETADVPVTEKCVLADGKVIA
jgi:hypothetical protein